MYSYDTFDKQLVDNRASQFRSQVVRRISGALNEDEFRPLRLMNGLYLEMHAYMLRIAIPYGGLSAPQMHMLGDIADKYDRGYGHFTTRQNIQFNWLELDRVPELLVDLAKVNMHAIQSSGNCIRNVTADPYAGATADEIADPRPTAELLRQWSSLHPEFAFLPRKFKIAVTGSSNDRAAIRVHDIGLQLVEDEAGSPGYKIFVGGGLGRTPMVGVVLCPFLPRDQLLAYLEATLRVYNLYGRRDNKYKARIKILTHELGIENFRNQVEAEFQSIKTTAPATGPWLSKIEDNFAVPPFEELPAVCKALDTLTTSNSAFARWVETNVCEHKVQGYAIANVSLKPIGGIAGDATSEQMHKLAHLADRFSLSEIRVTKNQNLVLPHVRQSDLGDLWHALQFDGLGEANSGMISDVVSCPGMDYCSLATARSIPISQQIARRFADPELQQKIGPVAIKISGCINACGHHHIGQIGILGLEKNGEEYYQIVLGGDDGEAAAIGKVSGRGFSKDDVVDAVERVIDTFLKLRTTGELFADAYRRFGTGPFKEALYETD